MKTLYEILEVSETASEEIIEKAYKVLAKKYHPDLQTEDNRKKAEERMKEINEAYEILSDENKRKDYDNKLEMERQEERQKENDRINYEAQNSYTQANYQNDIEYNQAQQEMQKKMQAQYEQKYQEAYEGYLRSLGYKIKYKWTWKNYRDLLITILIIISICVILWIFPPTHKIIMDFYNSNNIVKTVIDIIGNIFVGIWNAIRSIFNWK